MSTEPTGGSSGAPQGEEKPRIIVDDDYKARVEAEREAIRQQQKQASSAAEPAKSGESAPQTDAPLPPASFPALVTMLATQAIASLGQVPDPQTNQPVVRLPLAKHFIDMIGVLEEKTKGNLNELEAGMIENVLYELRLLYVAAQRNAGKQ